MARTIHERVILDIDSSESPVHGNQEEAGYNGHFECMCYHPLFCFNQFGDCEGGVLRPGNVHSADGWKEFIEPIVERYMKMAVRLLFRADAAFAKPELYEYIESRRIGYAIRLPANDVLQREITHLLVRPTEWPSQKPIVSYHDFAYQAQSWSLPRRVVAKVEWHQGELFPRVGFIITNLSYPVILAYNLGNFFRRLALPEAIRRWFLTSIQTRLIKIGGRLVRHARRLVFQLAEVMVSRAMFAEMLERIGSLRFNPG